MKKKAYKFFEKLTHKIYISYSLYLQNELQNHAGATAYFFLLSIIPILILFVYIFDSYLNAYPQVSEKFFELLSDFSEGLNKDFLNRIEIDNVSNGTFGIFSIINLIWISRLIMNSIQRAFGVIFPSSQSRSWLMTSIISFIIIPLLFSLAVMSVAANITIQFILTMSDQLNLQDYVKTLIQFLSRLTPFVIAFLSIYTSYRYLPVTRPTSGSALQSSLMCTFSIYLLKISFAGLFDVTKINLFYGVIGTLILSLIWVYFVFVLYFIFAQFAYVSDRIDMLVISQMFMVTNKQMKNHHKIEFFLFKTPSRIWEKYARDFEPGEVIFYEDDDSEDIFYVYKGKLGVYKMINGQNTRLSTIDNGEVLGEMAYLLKEKRTATVVAECPTVLFIFQPDMFEDLLESNRALSRGTIRVLCDRLNRMNPKSDPDEKTKEEPPESQQTA
ncbi:MAG: hypothetical protein B6244_12950 [Candidatus Cloacimonetes bacterium 4572_55]|nr:MAG: hypothetical protein B6244_12950 [Candidatus Cloacimonetes bacterium 4572_55]